MSKTYTEIKTAEALSHSQGDWVEAARLLCQWAEQDHALLLGMSQPYMRGAAAHLVQKMARQHGNVVSNSKTAPAAYQDATLASPIKATTDSNPLSRDVWDEIINHMQSTPDLNSEQHAKALHEIAKAFAAKRLEKHYHQRQPAPKGIRR